MHLTIQWLLLGCVLYSTLSPGGVFYREVVGVEVFVTPWREALRFPMFRAEWTSLIALSATAAVGGRVCWFTTLQWRSGARLRAALTMLVGLMNCTTVLLFALTVTGVRQGPNFVGLAIPFHFAVAAVQAHERVGDAAGAARPEGVTSPAEQRLRVPG